MCCVGLTGSRDLIKATLTFHFRPNCMWMEGWSSSKQLSGGVRPSRRPTFCLAPQLVACSSVFACIIKCVDRIAAMEYFWSSLKNEHFSLSARGERVVKLATNDIEAKETLRRQTLAAPTTFLSLFCLWVALQQSSPYCPYFCPLKQMVNSALPLLADANWDAHLCQCGIPIEHERETQ